MREGLIIKITGGYYYVKSGAESWVCTLRGRFRQEKEKILVGDRVQLKPVQAATGTGVIEKILPRKNTLFQPSIANISQIVVVISLQEPKPNLYLLDCFLTQTELAKVKTVLCFNKVDLGRQQLDSFIQIYGSLGYVILTTSAKTKHGLADLRGVLKNNISLLAGPSGVGKSSLLNTLIPGLSLDTREISPKLKQGKHTTRYVELILTPDNGLVADSPGFSSLPLPDIHQEELAPCFVEIYKHQENCKYSNCLHITEPDCAVQKAVLEGKINPSRYRNYLLLLKEMNKRKRY
ncbi:MAG: ribosome small subunit-dependent GTPase A [Peptococcaceae bacterium]